MCWKVERYPLRLVEVLEWEMDGRQRRLKALSDKEAEADSKVDAYL